MGWKLIIPIHVYNVECVKCGVVLKSMVKIGALYFCDNCFKKVFPEENPLSIKSGRDKYRHLCDVYFKKIFPDLDKNIKLGKLK